MPCDTITTQSIKLAKAMPELVKQAMEDLGWNIITATTTQITAENSYYETILWKAGKGLTIRGSNTESIASKLSKAYSKQAVTWAAQRAGWQVKSVNDNTLNVTRR